MLLSSSVSSRICVRACSRHSSLKTFLQGNFVSVGRIVQVHRSLVEARLMLSTYFWELETRLLVENTRAVLQIERRFSLKAVKVTH